eukprot:SAG11_NODE_1285_length_5300_cov_1.629494_2_plen_103_part_00
MVEKGGVSLVLALMSQHLSKPRMVELGCHLIMLLMWRRPETQQIVAALPYDSGLAVVLAAMRNFTGDSGVQCSGCGALCVTKTFKGCLPLAPSHNEMYDTNR